MVAGWERVTVGVVWGAVEVGWLEVCCGGLVSEGGLLVAGSLVCGGSFSVEVVHAARLKTAKTITTMSNRGSSLSTRITKAPPNNRQPIRP